MIRKYSIKQAKPADCATIKRLHRIYFPGEVELWDGQFWLVWHKGEAVAFLQARPSTAKDGGLYFSRVGVKVDHRGQGLMQRMMKVMQAWARARGFKCIYSDTTENPHSANNFVSMGWKIYKPKHPWFRKETIYWRKCLG